MTDLKPPRSGDKQPFSFFPKSTDHELPTSNGGMTRNGDLLNLLQRLVGALTGLGLIAASAFDLALQLHCVSLLSSHQLADALGIDPAVLNIWILTAQYTGLTAAGAVLLFVALGQVRR